MLDPEEWYDERTRKPTEVPMTHEETAALLFRLWNGGGRDEVVLMFRSLSPVSAACVAARLAGKLRDQSVIDWSELIDVLEAGSQP